MTPAQSPSAAPSKDAPVIWHIDDSQSDRDLFEEALRAWRTPYVLRTFVDAREALRTLSRRHRVEPVEVPDLIVLDVHMPGMNGFEFLAAKERYPAIAGACVVLLTGYPVDARIPKYYGLHAQNCLRKARDLKGTRTISAMIEGLLHSARASR
ncbi:MAG: response regulator [Elusimicrobia bacterium]|nr:response regulator [Elusimicrobiota bacterium]